MHLRDLLFYVLLISIVHFSTTSSAVIRPYRLLIVRLLPESIKNLEDIPDRWKTVHPEYKAPQVEIHLMKGQVSPDENWAFSNEYKYSNKYYDNAAKLTSTTDEEKVSRIGNVAVEIEENEKEYEKEDDDDVQDNIVMPDRIIPQIGSRNIITVPSYCPKGQRKDKKGVCRDVINS